MTRPPERIESMVDLFCQYLKEFWKTSPDMRFGQLLQQEFPFFTRDEGLLALISDEEVEHRLRELLGKPSSRERVPSFWRDD